jgi:hypothetical protein
VALALALVLPVMPARQASAGSLAEELGLDPAYIPSDMGQSDLDVYVSASGHSIRGIILDYWRANGASAVYGNPISEPFGAPNGLYSQAFERGVFQWSQEWAWTDDAAVRLMPIGAQKAQEARLATRSDGRRTGADRRAGAWRPGAQSEGRAAEVAAAGGRFSDVTGYSLAGEFGAWYDSHEGWFYLGEPISEPHRERGVVVQYFENAVMLSVNGVATPAPLPRETPSAYGFDPTPIAQDGRPEFSEALFYQNPNPYGVDPTVIVGRKRIVVSISQQTMTAYQGDQIVRQHGPLAERHRGRGLPRSHEVREAGHGRLHQRDRRGGWPRGRIRRSERRAVRGQGCPARDVHQLRGGGAPWRVLAQ